MRTLSFSLLALAALAFLVAGNPVGDDAKKDKDFIQGAWKAVSGEAGGQALSEEGFKEANISLTFKDDRYTFEAGGKTEEGKIKINADKKPKAIDFIIESGDDKGKTQLGIYAIDGGKFKLCVTKAGNTDRPTSFKTKEGTEDGSFVFEKKE